MLGGWIMIDSHVHTEFSNDSQMRFEHAMEQSRKIGMGMTFTEHLDLKSQTETGIEIDMSFDIDKYFNDYGKYKSSKLMLGIEIGMQESCVEENRKIASSYPFDYIIGSIHSVKGQDIYFPKSYDGKTKKQIFEQYFLDMVTCVKQNEFIDSLGHIDYISRYATFDDNEIYYNEFNDYINDVLKALVSNEKAMEINTRRLGGAIAYNNLVNIYKAYNQIGGKYVTIGSDAHHAEDIGKNFKHALSICEICNLKPVYFKERKMEYMSI